MIFKINSFLSQAIIKRYEIDKIVKEAIWLGLKWSEIWKKRQAIV
jgi:hypothetical protein